jgi:hypothetical protein
MDSHRKGELTEGIVIAELKRRSIPVSLPFGDNGRYDLVLESPDGELVRVQVKTGWIADGKVQFHAKSQHTNAQGNTYQRYDGDIDCFVIFSYELETLYLIREDEFRRVITLRVEEPQVENRRINWAHEFEFDERWPPDSTSEEPAIGQRESVTRVIDLLTAQNITVAKMVDTTKYNLIVETDNGRLRRMRVKSGWIYQGCIQYAHEAIPKSVDYLAIYVPETDILYIVPRSEFGSSISLRVDEPKKRDSRINWASEYAFPDHVPWA